MNIIGWEQIGWEWVLPNSIWNMDRVDMLARSCVSVNTNKHGVLFLAKVEQHSNGRIRRVPVAPWDLNRADDE